MLAKNQQAFTIVESVLFLALSGFFLLVALAGINDRTERVRFTDSARALASTLESEIAQIDNGVNTMNGITCTATPGSSGSTVATVNSGPGVPGVSEDCVYYGKMFVFTANSDKFRVHEIVGARLDTDTIQPDRTDTELLVEANLVVPTDTATGDPAFSEKMIDWRVEFQDGLFFYSFGGEPTSVFGFLRSPRSTRVIPFSIRDATTRNVPQDLTDLFRNPGFDLDADYDYSGFLNFANDVDSFTVCSGWYERNNTIELRFYGEPC